MTLTRNQIYAIQNAITVANGNYQQGLENISKALEIDSKAIILQRMFNTKEFYDLTVDIIQAIFPTNDSLLNFEIINILMLVTNDCPIVVYECIQKLCKNGKELHHRLNPLIFKLIITMDQLGADEPYDNKYEDCLDEIGRMTATHINVDNLGAYFNFCKKQFYVNKSFVFAFLLYSYNRFPYQFIQAFRNDLKLLVDAEILVDTKSAAYAFSPIGEAVLTFSDITLLNLIQNEIKNIYPQENCGTMYERLARALLLRSKDYDSKNSIQYMPPPIITHITTIRTIAAYADHEFKSKIEEFSQDPQFVTILTRLIYSRNEDYVDLGFKIINQLFCQDKPELVTHLLNILNATKNTYPNNVFRVIENSGCRHWSLEMLPNTQIILNNLLAEFRSSIHADMHWARQQALILNTCPIVPSLKKRKIDSSDSHDVRTCIANMKSLS